MGSYPGLVIRGAGHVGLNGSVTGVHEAQGGKFVPLQSGAKLQRFVLQIA